MHRPGLVVLAVLFLLGLLPATAGAQGYFAPSIGYDFGGDAGNCPHLFSDSCSEKRTSYGLTVGSLAAGVIGLEEDFTYAPDFFGTSTAFGGNRVLTLMTNLVVAIPAGPVRPYVSGGVGWMQSNIELAAGLGGSATSNTVGYNLGGGIMVFFPHHLGLRGDFRHMHSFSDVTIAGIQLTNTKLNFTRASVGLVIH